MTLPAKLFFHFFSIATFSHRRSARIKKLILQKLTGAPRNLGIDPFQTPTAILGPSGGHFGFLLVFVFFIIKYNTASLVSGSKYLVAIIRVHIIQLIHLGFIFLLGVLDT